MRYLLFGRHTKSDPLRGGGFDDLVATCHNLQQLKEAVKEQEWLWLHCVVRTWRGATKYTSMPLNKIYRSLYGKHFKPIPTSPREYENGQISAAFDGRGQEGDESRDASP